MLNVLAQVYDWKCFTVLLSNKAPFKVYEMVYNGFINITFTIALRAIHKNKV